MRRIITILLVLIAGAVSAQTYVYPNSDVLKSGQLDSVRMRTSGSVINGYIYLPPGYDSTQSKTYPLICFYHGAGGNGIATNALNDAGLLNMIHTGTIPYSSTIPGDTTFFIVYSVAGDYMGTGGSYAQIPIDYRFLLNYYRLRIDTTRVYATGLSAGGNQTLVGLVEDSTQFAAGVPMSTVWSNMPAGEENILQTTAPGWLWQLHGNTDNTAIFSLAQSSIQTYNTNRPTHKAQLMAYTGAHCCWNTFYDPTWKWTSANDPNPSQDIGSPNNISIYDWMLTHTISGSTPKPVVNAGLDQSLPYSTSSTTITGSASSANGSIISHIWSQVAGHAVTISTPSSYATTLTGLQNDSSYTFRLTATDNTSQSAYDDVNVSISSQTGPSFDSLYINFQNGFYKQGGVWNDVSATKADSTYGNFIDNHGVTTDVTLTNGSSINSGASGVNTNNGIFPLKVIASSYVVLSGNGGVLSLTLNSADRTKYYNISILPSQVVSSDTVSLIIGGDTAKVESYYDTTTLATIYNAVPDSNNTLSIKVVGSVGKEAVINALVIRQDSVPSPIPPAASAGKDIDVYYPSTSAYLNGSVKQGTGAITSQMWSQTSGNAATIVSPSSDTTKILGLSQGYYTFKFKVTDANSLSDSDYVTVYVHPSTDTLSYQIPVSNAASFWDGDTIFYQINDLSTSGIVDSLFDEQNITVPVTNFSSGFASRPYYPAQIVLDLGGLYKITQMQWYDLNGTDTFCIDAGSPYRWDSIAHVYEHASGAWSSINDTFYTRYLHIYYKNVGYQHVKELRLFGHLIGDSLERTHIPFPPYVTSNTMHDFMGVNVYGPTPPQVRYVAGTYRKYTNQSYIDYYPAGIPLDSVKFDYTTVRNSGSGPLIYYQFPNGVQSNDTVALWDASDGHADFPYLDSLGITQFWATQGVPQYAIDSGWKKSIDYTKFPGATGDTAAQYGRLARMAWVLGAVYGKNHYPLDSVQKVPGSDTATGAGVVHYIESGNENDGSWLTEPTYYDPRQAVAYNSAYYDGAEGTMGNRMGIKNADSTIQVLFWGDANSDHLGYLKGMAYWSYYTRADHKLPFDIYNIHHYNNNSPETFGGIGMNKFFGNIVDTARIYCHDCPVWLTEWGYDRNHHSNVPVAYVNGQDSAQTQAYWEARGWFELSFTGLDRAVLFQIQNDPLQTLYDTLAYVTYNSTGLADGHQSPVTYRLSYYAFPAYYFQHTIWTKLSNYKPDSIIYQNNDSLYVYRYRNVNSPDSVAYAVWSGTQTNRILNNYVLRTGHTSISIEQVTLADKYMDGVDTTKTTDSNGNLPITITESPKLYFTTISNIGGTLSDSASTQRNAGPTLKISDQSTIKDTTILQATATPGNSPVISYKWTQLSGPAIKFSLPSQNQNNAQVANIITNATYQFQVIAMDANGLTDSKVVTLNGSIIPPGTKPRALLYIINGKIVLINY